MRAVAPTTKLRVRPRDHSKAAEPLTARSRGPPFTLPTNRSTAVSLAADSLSRGQSAGPHSRDRSTIPTTPRGPKRRPRAKPPAPSSAFLTCRPHLFRARLVRSAGLESTSIMQCLRRLGRRSGFAPRAPPPRIVYRTASNRKRAWFSWRSQGRAACSAVRRLAPRFVRVGTFAGLPGADPSTPIFCVWPAYRRTLRGERRDSRAAIARHVDSPLHRLRGARKRTSWSASGGSSGSCRVPGNPR